MFLEIPLDADPGDAVAFNITPQPVFNKNFELLTADIRQNMERGYKVLIFSDKNSQIERLKSILIENSGLVPEFVAGKNIRSGFVDQEDRSAATQTMRFSTIFPQGECKKDSEEKANS